MIHESVETAKKNNTCGSAGVDPQERMIKESLAKIKNKIFVMSGKGGVGKSSIAANLATGLALKGFKTGLLDVDLHGPSIGHIMGLKEGLSVNADKKLIPITHSENLKVISMQSLMQEADQAVIWRGPAKTGMIKQFLGQVDWGELDFLIIDAPPGTGDEPISIVQIIPEARAVIVTTPQEVALSDVRKSINFCLTVKLAIAGLVENMGPFHCHSCGTEIALFKSGGGERTAKEMDIPFLGTLPFSPEVVEASDDGEPIITRNISNNFSLALSEVITKIVKQL